MLLVDASKYPGPALFQGIGFIAAAIYLVYLNSKDTKPPVGKKKIKPDDEVFYRDIDGDGQQLFGTSGRLLPSFLADINQERIKYPAQLPEWIVAKRSEYAIWQFYGCKTFPTLGHDRVIYYVHDLGKAYAWTGTGYCEITEPK